MLRTTRHFEVVYKNFVASTMVDPYCCCESVYLLGAHCSNCDMARSDWRIQLTVRTTTDRIDELLANLSNADYREARVNDLNGTVMSIKINDDISVLQSSYREKMCMVRAVARLCGVSVCGRRLVPDARIVGGQKASFGKWPWQLKAEKFVSKRCSSFFDNKHQEHMNMHMKTKAHVPPSDLLLRLGGGARVQIVASHPQFDPRTFEYDLALLRFYEPVPFQPNIIPICVPTDDTSFVGHTAHVTGWGRLYEDGPLPSVLQEVSVPVINNTLCESMYRSAGYIEHIPEIFICAGWQKGGSDSCEGDSGGPMVIQREDKRWLLAGVISWGIGCAEPNQPGVYTRISEFREWINQILQF
uniref:Serine proteinase stubble-2 n=1 Tax=Locusta migratoria migratoria TaxID=238695 RepID=A0A4Y1PU99_LOCMI|nr:serine proteinase stubble-2 [Locusta migratoria migratoria]